MLKEGTFVKNKYRKLLLCSTLGWLVSLLGSIADSIIAGLFIGSQAVSAVALISPIQSIIFCFTMMVAAGFSLMYSISLGAFEVDKSGKIAGMSIVMAVILGSTMTLIMLVGKDTILAFYGCTGQVYEYASQYYTSTIILAFIEPVFLFFII